MNNQDEHFMLEAVALAAIAANNDEVPVGAIVVKDGVVVGRGYNNPIAAYDPTAHAEINAIRDAAKSLGNYRLINTKLYVTLEPCLMCLGAIMHARISEVIYGTVDTSAGYRLQLVDKINLQQLGKNQQYGLSAKCAAILSEFFINKR